MENILNTLGPIVGAIALFTIGVSLIVFWVSMIASAIMNPRLSNVGKIAWVLIIVPLLLLGAIIYYFLAPKPRPVKSSSK